MNKYYTIEMVGGDCGWKPEIYKGKHNTQDRLMNYIEHACELISNDDALPHSYIIADEFDTIDAAVDYHGGRCYNFSGDSYKGGN